MSELTFTDRDGRKYRPYAGVTIRRDGKFWTVTSDGYGEYAFARKADAINKAAEISFLRKSGASREYTD